MADSRVSVHAKKRKKKNIIARFFTDFGARQVIILLIAVAVIFAVFGVGFMVDGLVIAALYLYAVAALVGIFFASYEMKRVGKKSPLYKRNQITLVITVVVLALAIAAIVVFHIFGITTERPL
jgi:hypothetical protein